MIMRVLVTGGAGYIGSHTCKALAAHGHEITVYDNLCTGFRELVRWGRFVHGDIRNVQQLRAALRQTRAQGVIHFASSIAVGESVISPGMYYNNNMYGSLCLLEAMRDEGVERLVASGTAAVYGLPERVPVDENAPLAPINPYGRTKLAMEWMLHDMRTAHGLAWVSLRYFNAAGADPDGESGECHAPETHLIPNVLRAARGTIPALRLFGDDYDTPDGTCIRDYIHVSDLATAHVLALEYLEKGGEPRAMNLGTGNGISVRGILDAVRRIAGRAVPYTVEARRAGDPARLVADASLAHSALGWKPRFADVDSIVETAWRWECRGNAMPEILS